MTRTQSPPCSPGFVLRFLPQRGKYQRDACDRKREESSVNHSVGLEPLGIYARIDASQSPDYDGRGRQKQFQETDSQRRERSEFVRRRRYARRLARKGCTVIPNCEKSESYVATELRHTRSADFTNAAVTIQRAYRAYRALRALTHLERRIIAASDPSHDPYAASSYLHARSAELGAFRAILDATPHTVVNQKVLHTTHRVMETLLRALERAAHLESEHENEDLWIHTTHAGHVGRHNHEFRRISRNETIESPKVECHHYEDKNTRGDEVVTVSAVNDDYEWPESNSDSDSSDNAEENFFELDLGEPESADPHDFESRITALRSLYSGSDQQKRWIARILTAPPVDRRERRSSVSKVPALLTITEDREREA